MIKWCLRRPCTFVLTHLLWFVACDMVGEAAAPARGVEGPQQIWHYQIRAPLH